MCCAAGTDVPGQQPAAEPSGGRSAVLRASVVGMQPQEGLDQIYGELGQGLYAGTEISANMRIHPSRTFLPGQTYTPEVRASSVSGVRSSRSPFLPGAHPLHVHASADLGWLGPHKQCLTCAMTCGAGAGPGEAGVHCQEVCA